MANLWFGSDGTVTLAQHCDGTGWSEEIGPGQHHHSVWGHNDDASYINVPAGMKATMHQHSRNDSNFENGQRIEVVGPATKNFCQDYPNFNDELSELDVEVVSTDSDTNQDGSSSESFELDEDAAIDYCKDRWGYSTEQCEELVDYAIRKIIPNETWMQSEMEKATENDRTLNEQVMHAANWQLYKKDGCKYCVEETPEPVGTEGTTNGEQKAGLFGGGNTVMYIVGGLAVLAVGYMVMKK